MDETMLFECRVCGSQSPGDHCLYCYTVICRVCRLPIFLDESLHRDALGVEHMRCSGGTLKVRHAAMGAPHARFGQGVQNAAEKLT